MTTDEAKAFLGPWKYRFWYPSKDDASEEMTEDLMTTQVDKGELVLTSRPNEEGSYAVVRLAIDDNVATGRWHETTSPTGQYKSAMYSGAGQMLVSDDKRHLEGKWAGVGYDRKANQLRIYTGRWELTRSD